jgi:hypothetical protein
LAALCATLATCRFPTAPELPAGAVPLTPPAVFARWWAMAESCSGVRGPLDAVSFYEVPGVSDFDRDGRRVLGYWTAAGNQIVLAGDAALVGSNVRHEMLHALIRVGGHPRDQFLEKCGGVVDCGVPCIDDAGPAPAADPTALSVTPGALEVTVQVAPAGPTSAYDGGFFTLTVAVRNTAPHPVVARLGPTNSLPRSFQFDLRGPSGALGGSEIVLDPSAVRFGPGETKRQLFDFSIGGGVAGRQLTPGTYTVLGAYGTHWSGPATLAVGP